jgi:plasmid stabilization system protein ParE
MRRRLSKLALEDIAQIHDYAAAEWGAEQAVKYINALWDAFENACNVRPPGVSLLAVARNCRIFQPATASGI